MDPFVNKPQSNLPTNNTSASSVNNPPPMSQPQITVPPPSTPTMAPKTAFGTPKERSGLTLTAIYVLVLIIGMLGVFFWQNNKLESTQKDLAAVQSVKNADESANVDKGKFQSVFLVGGQVYFGKIDSLNSQFLTLTSIYYINTPATSQTSPSSKVPTPANANISLVKLGCEIHGPADKMVIERSQVIYWENLKDDAQIVKAMNEYAKQNPNGQKCS